MKTTSPVSVSGTAGSFRLSLLLLAGLAAFTLTVLLLSRQQARWVPPPPQAEALQTVERYLAALRQGDLGSAYQLLSVRYRQMLPFDRFRRTLLTRRLAQAGQPVATEVAFADNDQVALNVLIWTSTEVLDLQFLMRKAAGRWWIDGLRTRLRRHAPEHVQGA